MKRFKLITGEVCNIEREAFEEKTRNAPPYVQSGKDRKVRQFALCPACNNPIQLIGLYSKNLHTAPYGKHYNRDVKGIAKHNEQSYWFCPYASHNYSAKSIDDRKPTFTSFEAEIYKTLRNNFDLAIYILKQDTGIYIGPGMARKLLENYIASEAWMYCFATIYNLPWMFIFTSLTFPLYGKLVRRDSAIYRDLEKDKRIDFVKHNDRYFEIRTKEFVSLNYRFLKHKRSVVNDEVVESFEATVDEDISKNGNGPVWKVLSKEKIEINEHRFPNLICSLGREKYRDKGLLEIAEELMPEIPEE